MTSSLRLSFTWATGLAASSLLILSGCAAWAPPDPVAVIQRAETAMGGAALNTLRYAGSGTGATFGQAWQPGTTWPKITVTSFSRLVDYQNGALRQEAAVTRAEANGGGALPLMGLGEQRSVGMLQGTWAWNMVGPAPAASPVALDGRIHDLWTTPHGVLKAALKNKATASTRTVDGKPYTMLSFTEPGRFEATAYVNADNLIERIDSRQPNPVMGDTPSVITFSGYRDYAGVKFPSRIRQTMGGTEVLDLQVSDVQPNAPADIAAPELVRQFAERVVAEKAADGVWHLAGGSHNSVLIEMKDYAVLVETPLYDGRSAAVLAEVRKLVPGKPLRYVVNSHHHFDHAGGLRTAVSEGATLITSGGAKPWYDQAMRTGNSIRPDAMARSGRSATVEGVSGKRVLNDGARTVEISEIQGSVHAQGFLMVYLPKEKILIEADAYTPGPPNAPAPAQPNGNHVNLVQNIEQNKLAVERILPLHGRIVPVSELMTAVGK
jgi:glyoxylase-like metal-dependent hydrolase (beta-lactamase superfamily II)